MCNASLWTMSSPLVLGVPTYLVLIIIIIIIIKYCQNNLMVNTVAYLAPKLPDHLRSRLQMDHCCCIHINSPVGESKQEVTVDLDIRLT